jgi:putative ABC transport system ATP-binding protein
VVVLEVLEKVNRELGTLTVLITHNVGIADMADRVIRLSDGQIGEVRANPSKKSARDLSW